MDVELDENIYLEITNNMHTNFNLDIFTLIFPIISNHNIVVAICLTILSYFYSHHFFKSMTDFVTTCIINLFDNITNLMGNVASYVENNEVQENVENTEVFSILEEELALISQYYPNLHAIVQDYKDKNIIQVEDPEDADFSQGIDSVEKIIDRLKQVIITLDNMLAELNKKYILASYLNYLQNTIVNYDSTEFSMYLTSRNIDISKIYNVNVNDSLFKSQILYDIDLLLRINKGKSMLIENSYALLKQNFYKLQEDCIKYITTDLINITRPQCDHYINILEDEISESVDIPSAREISLLIDKEHIDIRYAEADSYLLTRYNRPINNTITNYSSLTEYLKNDLSNYINLLYIEDNEALFFEITNYFKKEKVIFPDLVDGFEKLIFARGFDCTDNLDQHKEENFEIIRNFIKMDELQDRIKELNIKKEELKKRNKEIISKFDLDAQGEDDQEDHPV
jgi:hypothetical protein